MTIQETHFRLIILLIIIRISLSTNDNVNIFAISIRAHFVFTKLCLLSKQINTTLTNSTLVNINDKNI